MKEVDNEGFMSKTVNEFWWNGWRD